METYVDQLFEPDEVKRRLGRIRVHQSTIATMMGISDTGFSAFLTGRRGLSTEAQRRFCQALHFLEDLHRQNPELPPDLNNVEIIKPLWESHRRRCDETEVLKLAEEIRARNEQEKSGEGHAQ